ncbi:S-adenosyl-L-methionine-dependent methyltransferase [Lasiosphaeria miniovina]|uniref:S-adenosyl-L-methionine-dependent methyltransferase n=1 Tax=Lasiosphaeria miniovina TaxID=1954250 RepID=A0AA40ATU2_9PEZI|nr:S-adenosyl-L-methionine-dependent methyltransferase [Lasiosphaeria miniovina]KAK0721884.1 S-adenosyl-L-methionine-dependent methyltransferase [Lasiosphaeria miniovina]
MVIMTAQEQERLELQHYMLYDVTMEGELFLSPGGKHAKRVLDMGAGTGTWAIGYAHAYPEAEVIGVDLSPIFPEWIPRNVQFVVDDLEDEWNWTKRFDFIVARFLSPTAFRDLGDDHPSNGSSDCS